MQPDMTETSWNRHSRPLQMYDYPWPSSGSRYGKRLAAHRSNPEGIRRIPWKWLEGTRPLCRSFVMYGPIGAELLLICPTRVSAFLHMSYDLGMLPTALVPPQPSKLQSVLKNLMRSSQPVCCLRSQAKGIGWASRSLFVPQQHWGKPANPGSGRIQILEVPRSPPK